MRERLAGDLGCLVRATAVRETARDGGDRVLDTRRGIDATDDPEQLVETVTLDSRGKQRMPNQQQVAVLLLQRVDDVGKQLSVSSASSSGSLTCTRASAGSWYCLTRWWYGFSGNASGLR